MPSPASSYSSNAPSRPSNTQISRAGGRSAAHCAPSATGSRLPARTNTGKRSSGVATRIRRPPSRSCSVNRSYQPPGGSATSVTSPPSASGRTTGLHQQRVAQHVLVVDAEQLRRSREGGQHRPHHRQAVPACLRRRGIEVGQQPVAQGDRIADAPVFPTRLIPEGPGLPGRIRSVGAENRQHGAELESAHVQFPVAGRSPLSG